MMWTWINGIKLKCRQVNSDCTKFFFTNVVMCEWNKLPPSVVQCSTISSSKNKLNCRFLQLSIHWWCTQVLVAFWLECLYRESQQPQIWTLFVVHLSPHCSNAFTRSLLYFCSTAIWVIHWNWTHLYQTCTSSLNSQQRASSQWTVVN